MYATASAFMKKDQRLKAPPRLRYICRLESAKTRAWRVQYVRGLKVPIQLYFTDASYGGKAQALEAAIEFRDAVVAFHSPAPTPAHVQARRNLKFKDKPEQHVGISLLRQVRKGGTVSYTWSAKVKLDGLNFHRSWSVRTHGYTKGFQNASRYRNKMTGQPVCQTPPPPPAHLLEWARIQGIFIDYPEVAENSAV